MKAVYSFWGRPFWAGGGGYLNGRHFLALLGLSVHLSRKHFGYAEMNACAESKSIFEDTGWFDAVHETMEDIQHLPNHHWAVAKMVAFSRQDKPFLHIDNDVLLNKPLPDRILLKPVIIQCQETWKDFRGNYSPQINAINALPVKPKYWNDLWPVTNGKAFSYNTGIMGGCDIGFIKEYALTAVNWMIENGVGLRDVNTTIEQAYLAMCAAALGEPVTNLITDWRNTRQAKELGYVHYWGGTKRDTDSKGALNLEKIAKRVEVEYPDVYATVIRLHKQFNKR